jgi:hypothetical protein
VQINTVWSAEWKRRTVRHPRHRILAKLTRHPYPLGSEKQAPAASKSPMRLFVDEDAEGGPVQDAGGVQQLVCLRHPLHVQSAQKIVHSMTLQCLWHAPQNMLVRPHANTTFALLYKEISGWHCKVVFVLMTEQNCSRGAYVDSESASDAVGDCR